MFIPIFRKLFWKEFRTFGPLWIAVLLLAGSLLALIYSQTVFGIAIQEIFVLSILITMLYAVGCSASTFAWEIENGTFGRLRSLPITSWQIALPKFTWSVASSFALFLVICLLGMPFYSSMGTIDDKLVKLLIIMIPVIAETLVWGTLFSTLTRQPTLAIILTVLALFAYNAFWAGLANLDLRTTSFSTLWGYTALRAFVFLPIIGLTAYRVTRWFDCCRAMESRRSLSGLLDLDADLGIYDHYAITNHPFVALLKHYYHQNRSLFRILFVSFFAVAIILLVYRFTSDNFAFKKLPVSVALVPWLVTVCTILASNMFGGDQRQAGFRFLAHRNISPRMIWASRFLFTNILFWIFWSSTFAIIGLYWIPDWIRDYGPQMTWSYLLYVFFAAGFLLLGSGAICSMLFKSRLIAWAGSMCVVLLCESASSYVVGFGQINPLLFLPAIGLLLGSYFYTPAWICERNSRRSHYGWLAPLGLCFLLFIMFITLMHLHDYVPSLSPHSQNTEASHQTAQASTNNVSPVACDRFGVSTADGQANRPKPYVEKLA